MQPILNAQDFLWIFDNFFCLWDDIFGWKRDVGIKVDDDLFFLFFYFICV